MELENHKNTKHKRLYLAILNTGIFGRNYLTGRARHDQSEEDQQSWSVEESKSVFVGNVGSSELFLQCLTGNLFFAGPLWRLHENEPLELAGLEDLSSLTSIGFRVRVNY
ncbi:hypothetical protein BCON_0270g00010 [Botryotinia convoluta]|uniref:Uncharacterized protein n=1 Tax=Botryotinia convoluta TaxID=54673 RepID=A0A4Z1HF56_9HELO|nr:hypothetical protein BCON_0270g00010 [Botryotinia convoluta]